MWDDNCIEFLSLSLQMVKMQSQSWGSFLEEKGIFFCASLNVLSCFSKRLWWGFWCKMFLVLVSGFGLPQRLYLSILFLKSWIEVSYKTLIWNYINPIFPFPMLLLVIFTDVFSIGTCNYGPLGLAALSWMCQGFLFFNFFFLQAALSTCNSHWLCLEPWMLQIAFRASKEKPFKPIVTPGKLWPVWREGRIFFLLFKMIKKHCNGLVSGRKGRWM